MKKVDVKQGNRYTIIDDSYKGNLSVAEVLSDEPDRAGAFPCHAWFHGGKKSPWQFWFRPEQLGEKLVGHTETTRT